MYKYYFAFQLTNFVAFAYDGREERNALLNYLLVEVYDMAENRFPCSSSERQGGRGQEMVSIETNRILDSCRDRDCFEDVKVLLTDFGYELLERTSNVRVKDACIAWTYIGIDPVKFNRGFYSVDVRFYVKLTFEACVCVGKALEFSGLAVCDKKVILYGGEGNVSVFRSSDDGNGFCKDPFREKKSGASPVAVCEVADPIALGARVVKYEDHCGCACCYAEEIPENICCCFDGDLCEMEGQRELLVSLGFFSVIRLERPGQYLVNAVECCVPKKECAFDDLDPCSLFRHMEFPVGEFSAGCVSYEKNGAPRCNCKG